MGELRKYRRIEQTEVAAVQLDLETDGFTYEKWGGTQRCRARDWLVDNQGDVYTIDAEVFAKTYEQVSHGVYKKTAPVWARQSTEPGTIGTKEGSTDYDAGDFLVYNDPEEKDGWAIEADKFRSLYELAD